MSLIFTYSLCLSVSMLLQVAPSTWKLLSIFSDWVTFAHPSRFSSCLLSSGKLSLCFSDWARCLFFVSRTMHVSFSTHYWNWFSCLSTLDAKQFEISGCVLFLLVNSSTNICSICFNPYTMQVTSPVMIKYIGDAIKKHGYSHWTLWRGLRWS